MKSQTFKKNQFLFFRQKYVLEKKKYIFLFFYYYSFLNMYNYNKTFENIFDVKK